MAGKLEKATHQDATEFEGPVDTGDAHGKRPADKKNNGQQEPDTSVSKKDPGKVFPSGKVAEEEIKALFAGVEGLSEDFSARAAVLLEGALSERINILREQFEEEYKTKLDEAVQQLEEDYTDRLDSYLAYCVENYMEENELAIENGIKTEIAEQVLQNMVSIVESHGLTIPDDKVDVVEALTAEVAETEKNLNEAINKTIELEKRLEKWELQEALRELSADLSDAGKDKLSRLAENISYASVEDYKNKVTILKESISEKNPVESGKTMVEQLTETVEVTKSTSQNELNERQKAYKEALRNLL